jgi:hypothetical protein
MYVWMVLMDDGDVGWSSACFGPYDDRASALADEDEVYAWVKDKGYREEYEDYHVRFSMLSSPDEIRKRYPRGRFG